MNEKILIVDDDPVVLKSTSMMLAGSGYGVVTAEDGSAAVSKARTEKPDLILLDLIFPPDVAHGGGVPWDGFLIINWLRRMEEARDIPVIIVTATDPTHYKTRGQAVGVHAFLRKPVNKQELAAAIQQVLSVSKPKPKPPTGGKRVLFVDDEGDWRFVAGTYLQEAGFEVFTAKDAAETMRRMQKIKLDAIVLDVNLGGENSVLLMELLKQNHPEVPIIIYTGLDKHDDAVQSMLKQGARQYLRKGTMGELCDAIRQAVN
jgi:twitching motility two-component system response regulator PilH